MVQGKCGESKKEMLLVESIRDWTDVEAETPIRRPPDAKN